MPLCAFILLTTLPQIQVHLDLPHGLPASATIELQFQGRHTTLELRRRSLRSDNFILQNSDGPIAVIPPSRTYFGSVRGLAGWDVVASLEPRGLLATLLGPTGQKWRLTPTLPGNRVLHSIARAAPEPFDKCGVDDSHSINNGAGGRANSIPPPPGGNAYLSPFPWDWKMRKSRIAFDATYDYWLREGQTVAGVTAGVEYQLGENDLLCSRDAMVSYELTGIVIRQSQYYIGTTSGALLNEFANEWDGNQGHIPRESAVMLEDYQGDGIAGLAWVGTLGGGLAYAGLYWDRGYSPGIIAHEIGHNWGAGHVDCWPWGGSAMCGSWLLYGPETTDIIQWRSSWLGLPEVPPYADAVRPYADPDWTSVDTQADLFVDALDNDYDANMEHIHVSGVDPISEHGGSVSIAQGSGPGGRDLIDYRPNRTILGPYTDTFWYAASDSGGLEHWTPVTISVGERNMVSEWKFEEGGGTSLHDSSGSGNHGSASGQAIYAELSDPNVMLECASNPWSPQRNLWDNIAVTDFASAEQGVISASFTRDPADGTWIEMDFGSILTFEGFRHQDRANSAEWIGKSKLWFSDDSTFDLNDQGVDIEHQQHGDFVTYPFNAINARYVRWEITEQYDPGSSLHSLGGKEIALLYDTKMAALPTPSLLWSANSKSGSGADNLMDGVLSTEFVSPGQGVVSTPLTLNPADGTWAEFDFGTSYNFEGASFLDLPPITGWTGESRLWFGSSLGFSTSDPMVVWNHGNQDFTQVLDFAPIQARYLRWEVSAKAPISWFDDLGGRELTMFTDLASSPGFARVPGPHGDCIEVQGKLKAGLEGASLIPTAANSPFTINLFINPDSGLVDGTMLGGFGDPGTSAARMFEINSSGLSFAGINSSWSPPSGSWSMVTATYDGSSLSIYVDGNSIGSWALGLAACSADLHLVPANPGSPDAYFRGKLDEFAVWDHAMNSVEVAELLTGGAAHGPIPFDTHTMVLTSPRLSWTAGRNAPQHDVYLATDFVSARDALPGSADYIGRFTPAHIDLQNLSSKTWYFWRVDEVFSNGDIVPGKVWRFRTELPWTTSVEEGFADGTDGQHLNGLGGGLGFASAWNVPIGNGYKHRIGSIGAYPANLPFTETDGYFERKTVANMAMNGHRQLDGTAVDIDLAGDGNFYLSFAVRLSGPDSEMTIMCGLQNSSTGETILAGSEGGIWSISGACGSASTVAARKSRTQFMVMRIDAAGQSNDSVRMKIYDSANDLVHQSDSQLSGMGPGPDQWNLISSGADASGNFDQLFIRAGGNKTFSTATVEIDEIRIGRSWTDVTGL